MLILVLAFIQYKAFMGILFITSNTPYPRGPIRVHVHAHCVHTAIIANWSLFERAKSVFLQRTSWLVVFN